MNASAIAPVLRLASLVTDPRRHNRLHSLQQMIVMALIAILSGADGWSDVVEFCKMREQSLKQFLSLPHGIPSRDTFGRVFARIEPMQLEEVLRQWMNALHISSGGRLIAIDGKSLRRSFEHAWDTSSMAHIVSAFASENRLVLAQIGVLDKENEITAIPKLLSLMDLEGSTVTIDAIGCQRAIAQQITKAGGDYILQVKANQETLHKQVKGLMDGAIIEKLAEAKISQHEEGDCGHGRIETRQVWVSRDVKDLGTNLLTLWPSIKAIAAVDRKREVVGKVGQSVERSYYILSNSRCNAEEAGKSIRSHWSIENNLHYVLDVSFNEDQCRVRKDHGPENLSRLRGLTANLLQRNPTKRSIRVQRKQCAWSEKYLYTTLLRGLSNSPAAT